MTSLLLLFSALIAAALAAAWYSLAHKTTFIKNLGQLRAPLIVFDFDGTICPSYPLFIDQINFLADAYKLRKIKADEFEDFKNMTPQQIMKTLGVSLFKLPFLLKKARLNIQQRLLELKPVPGIVEVLQELKQRHCSLGILTSNSSQNVQLYLQKYKIDLFDFVYAGNNIFGKEKHLKAILKKVHLDRQIETVIYVGDEIRDMEAAQKAGFTSIGVTWGYNSINLLQKSHPDFISESPAQLLTFIKS